MKNKNLTIKQWAVDDRPREKLILKGASSLSNSELIAILLGSGTKNETAVDVAQKLLQQVKNSLHELAIYDYNKLCRMKGIGSAKAVRLIAALELGRRRSLEPIFERKKIQSSSDVATIFMPLLQDLLYEEFWILFLNRAHMIIEKKRISQGGISGTITDIRLIFKMALDYTATAIILIHNHPSGNLSPSKDDIQITEKIKEAAKLLDINVLDHIIVSNVGYYSFADEQILK